MIWCQNTVKCLLLSHNWKLAKVWPFAWESCPEITWNDTKLHSLQKQISANIWMTSVLKDLLMCSSRRMFLMDYRTCKWLFRRYNIPLTHDFFSSNNHQRSDNRLRWVETQYRHSRLAIRLASEWRQEIMASVPPDRSNDQRCSHGFDGPEGHQLLPRHGVKDWR